MTKSKTTVPPKELTLNLKPPPSTGDVFADSCFILDSPPAPDDRIGAQMEGLKDVPGLVKKGLLEEAWMILDTHHLNLKDFDFIYAFKALILQKNGQPDAAKKTLLAGLKFGLGKFLLYERLGFLFFETGQLSEAIKCWIKSIVAMKMLNKMSMWEPFLYLAAVAKALSDDTRYRVLMARVREISGHEDLSLDDNALKKLNELTHQLSKASVLKALDILCRHYIPGQDPEPHQAIPGINPPAPPNVPAGRDHLSEFKSLFGENKKKAWITRFIMAILALSLILFFLQFLKFPEDKKDISPSTDTPEITWRPLPLKEIKPASPETPIAKVIQKKAPNIEMEQKKEDAEVESPEESIPNKEKYPFLKSKAKTTNPDIKKKD